MTYTMTHPRWVGMVASRMASSEPFASSSSHIEPHWSVGPRAYGRNDGISLSSLGHKRGNHKSKGLRAGFGRTFPKAGGWVEVSQEDEWRCHRSPCLPGEWHLVQKDWDKCHARGRKIVHIWLGNQERLAGLWRINRIFISRVGYQGRKEFQVKKTEWAMDRYGKVRHSWWWSHPSHTVGKEGRECY